MPAIIIDNHGGSGGNFQIRELDSQNGPIIVLSDTAVGLDVSTIGLLAKPSFEAQSTASFVGKIPANATENIRIGSSEYLRIVNLTSSAVLADLYPAPKPARPGTLELGLTSLSSDTAGQLAAITQTAIHDIPRAFGGLLNDRLYTG